ncbi:MAG: hypothetical protein CVU57_28235 [Deltaproteobacteria bacterium HGW-Deltaproteobacteria-15]|jgi:hypothetical protein|nr:MAG: hypothetical protein CVU57_28235 [Deltaproteobacteria bacterium HGW-Deltaproteobacteria-15]
MKRILQIFSILLLLLTLSGCPIMMVPMMGPMMKDKWNSGDPKVEAVVQDLAREGSAALAENQGPYDTIVLDNAKVSGKFIREGRFRSLLLEALRSGGKWKVLDGEESLSQAHGASPVFLNAELYEGEAMFHLSLETGDSRTKKAPWKRTFSRPVPESPSSHSH